MIVGIVYCEIYIPHVGSLKEKRSITNSLKSKIQSRFKASVAEVDFLDKWQRAAFGISMVSNNKTYIDAAFDRLESFFNQEHRIMVSRWDVRFT
ncbi:DUF503 domain-containing protein [candidate division KSB1 bacterium]